MRKDMSKVIVERPRLGGGLTRKGRALDTDLLPQKQGMRKPHVKGWNNKELNENLAPLRRFLVSKIGQHWDNVYSEICENLRATNTVQQHVRDHIADFVDTKTRRDRHGQIWVDRYSPTLLEQSWRQMYVDPDTGLLLRNPHYRSYTTKLRERAEQQRLKTLETQRSYPDGTELRRVNGIWYQVEMRAVPPGKLVPYLDHNGVQQQRLEGGVATDCITGKIVCSVRGVYRYDWAERYAESKRQLSSEELQHYKISNSPENT